MDKEENVESLILGIAVVMFGFGILMTGKYVQKKEEDPVYSLAAIFFYIMSGIGVAVSIP